MPEKPPHNIPATPSQGIAPRPSQGISPEQYRPGSSTTDRYDFSGLSNPLAHPITAGLAASLPLSVNSYPDPFASSLKKAIASYEQVDESCVLAGNGVTGLIWLALQSLAPRSVLFVGPVAGEYIRACASLGIPYSILTPPVEESFGLGPQELQKLWETGADLVVLGTPNAPAAITYPNFYTVLDMLRAPRVLIDNSFREFLYGTAEYAENAHAAYCRQVRPGVSLFTLHSFSHFFAAPGLRLGYLLGDKLKVERLQAAMPAYATTAFAQEMGLKLLENIELYHDTAPILSQTVQQCGYVLRQCPAFIPDHVFDGPGFLCCGLANKQRVQSFAKALKQHRMRVAVCDGVPGMPQGFLRVQAHSLEAVEEFAKAATVSANL